MATETESRSVEDGTTSPEQPSIPATISQSSRGNVFFAGGSDDWLETLPQTPHVNLFRNCNFAATSLGPLREWGPALRMYASMVFADSRLSCIYWGPERVSFYNVEFSVTLSHLSSSNMGKPFIEALPDIWDQFRVIFDQVTRTGRTVDMNDIVVHLDRGGIQEETYFFGQFIPLRGDSGEIEGFYNTVVENTHRVLHERRRRVVERLAAMTPHPIVDEMIKQMMDVLRMNPKDIPMAMLFSYDESPSHGGHTSRFRGGIGLSHELSCAPTEGKLNMATTGLAPYFRQVQATSKPVVLSQANGSLQAMDGVFDSISWSGYGEASREVVIVPLSSSGTLLGFYVQGTNPRRPYDEATEMSIIDMARQIENKWGVAISAEQAKLREQYLVSRVTDSESRLTHMAQNAPFGMYQITPDKKLKWANEQFYDITGHSSRKPDLEDYFAEVLADEERDDAREMLDRLLEGEEFGSKEVRLKSSWTPPGRQGNAGEHDKYSTWILDAKFPLVENGKVKLVMGYVIAISHQKWAESVQMHNAASAAEAKRRQEEFIDSTSHEMRNPLTAMTQLADGIAHSLHNTQEWSSEKYHAVLESNVDAANTILACAAHQKRVINDVLILTRLESKMLDITPVAERPSKVVSDTMKMFAGEANMNGASLEAVKDSSYDTMHIDYVLIDTSRLTQILINLISNAIKFTGNSTERKVSVVYGVQVGRAPQFTTKFGDLDWLPALERIDKKPALPELKDGEEKLYLYFCIQDTGTGMSAEEMKRLFKRFSQASSRTHITYGGSGIGLYICRQLAEKQGGAVGVAARTGEGAVFAFYIETRRAAAPESFQHQRRLNIPAPNPATTSERSGLPRRVTANTNSKDLTLIPQAPAPSVITQPAPPSKPQQSDRRYNILLVEDNLVNQRVLAAQLRKAKCTVLIANHGIEALQQLTTTDCWRRSDTEGDTPESSSSSSSQPTNKDDDPRLSLDVILLDWEMPQMNGLDCCKRIRELEKTGQINRHMTIIATTANVRKEQLDQAMQAGMDTVLTKPFTCAEALNKIEETIGS